jgi:hypothetical protein
MNRRAVRLPLLSLACFSSFLIACSGQGPTAVTETNGTDPAEEAPAGSDGESQGSTAPKPGAPQAGGDSSSSGGTNTGSPDAGGGSSNDSSAPMPAAPNPDTIPWSTGTTVGYGVGFKDTQNPAGDGVFIAYATDGVTLAQAEAWATALYRDSLMGHGIRYVFAVQGPSDELYSQREIGNTKVVGAMLPLLAKSTRPAVVVAHQNGSVVAHELLTQLNGNLDPQKVSTNRVVYFDLDGTGDGLTSSVVNHLKHAWFVGAHAANTGVSSVNANTMQSVGQTYAQAGGYFEVDVSGAGCTAAGDECVGMALVTTLPHDKTNADLTDDYGNFTGRGACHAFIDAKATAAGL